MQTLIPPVFNKAKTLSGDLLSNLSVNDAQRRRLAGVQDPSLLFGTAVFSQMVAADLARDSNADVEDLVGDESGADADQTQSLVVEEAEGLFGALAGSASGLVPLAGAGAVIASVPGSGSDAASVLGSGTAGNTTEEEPQSDNNSQGSVVSRNFNSLRNGGNPNADGAQQASPEQEAAGAQTSAVETQQQFTSAGGANPFVSPSPEVPASVPQAPQTGMEMPATATTSVAQGDVPTRVDTGSAASQDIPLSMGYSTAAISSQAMPQANNEPVSQAPAMMA